MMCLFCQGQARSPIPPEVKFKSRYVNPARKPAEFTSAMLWGIAIADTRVRGHEHARVEIAHTELTCRVDGRDLILNNDSGSLRGGLYQRRPWFGTDAHNPMPMKWSIDGQRVILAVGTQPDRIWHFWAASPRAEIPVGKLEGCAVTVRARISRGALLQVGFDYWRDSKAEYGSGGNNHEAGASDWYLPSENWQTARFSGVGTRH